jgi:probable F420-dependent oxidoreductase
VAEPEPLSVRVGVGWNPFDRAAVGGPVFWDTVRLLEQNGWDSLWLSDIATGLGVAPLPMLAAVAARTERLKLGTSVINAPPRNPLLLAKELATLDLISGGRFFPAFGIGQSDAVELAALGLARDERGARLEECIHVIRELWRGEPVTYKGRFTTLENVTVSPKPTRPRIEPWLGGSTPAAVRRVGRIADGWLTARVSPAEFAELLEVLRESAATAGRAVPEDHFGTVLFADDVGETRELLYAFREAGATKFVLYPRVDDPRPWLEELKPVVDELEAHSVYR